jgi:acetylornithine/succinyldiaminopimelate/putrescine aminotransferase/acyl-coenzyme A synthetase/AMP-(fatty) acid ligase/predicted amino acid dehydrogenase
MSLGYSGGTPMGDPINARLLRKLRATGLCADIVGASGSVLTEKAGRAVLDMVPGHGALPLGHGASPVTKAVAGVMQASVANLVQPYFTGIVQALARRLMSLAPMVTEQVNLATTGAEAIEIALNSARLVTGRLRFIAAVGGAHGKSIGALSVTHTRVNNDFAELAGTIFVPFGDAAALERALKAEGDNIAGVILEPVQCEGGVHIAPKGYFDAVRALCDTHGALLIHDEQMTGLGRTGHLFATEWTGGEPDIIILGESLGGGVMPVSACLLGQRAVSNSLDFQQLSLFAGNTYAATAAHAFLDVLLENDGELMRQVRRRGTRLSAIHKRLQLGFSSLIKEVRGVGLIHGIEIAPCSQVIAGSNGAFLQLARAGDQYPFLMMGHMLSNGVRATPAANTVNVLRVVPSLTVTDAECDAYGTALEVCLDALAAQDTVGATKHVTGATVADRVKTAVDFTGTEPVGEIGEDEGRFGFIVHQLEIDDVQNLDPVLRQITREQRHLLTEMLGQFDEPLVLSRARITGADGSTAVGDFILLPRSAQQLLNMPGDEAAALVQKAVTLAVRRGARIVGLGGYTSIVTRGGQLIDPLGSAVTTGNGFTIEAALMAVEYACTVLGRNQSQSTAAIIGAAGSIGSGLVQMISARARRLYLFLNPATPLEKSVRRLQRSITLAIEAVQAGELEVMAGSLLSRALPMLAQGDTPAQLAARLLEDPGFFVLSTSCARDLHNADVVYSATNSTDRLVNPEDLRTKSVVCDLSRPGNISFRCREQREDVLLMDGGVISFPGRPELALGIPMPRGVAFACIAETVMLALRKHYRNTSVGASPSPKEITMLRGIAAETGFTLADLRAFDKPIGRVNWNGLIDEAARLGAADLGPDGLSRSAMPADPRSIQDEAIIDFYERLVGMRAMGTECDDPAIVAADGTVYTWVQLHRAAGKVADYMRQLGIGQEMRILLAARGNFEHIACLAGLWRIGAAPIILDVDLPTEILAEMIRATNPALCLHAPGYGEKLLDLLPLHPIPTADALLSPGDGDPPSVCRKAASEAFVIFTSGSTGAPKAVSHSLRDLVNMAENYGRNIAGLSPKDNVLVTSKLCYSYGISVSVTALYHGAALLLGSGRFDPEAVLDQIVSQRATVMFSVPTIYSVLLKQPERKITTLRLCIAAGEPSSVFVGDAWERLTGVAIQDGLGTTEIMSFACATPSGERSGRSIGKVTPGFEIELRNAWGQVTRIGEAGVAWVRSNTQARGYVANAKAEAEVFRDGWYCTSDLMRMDGDGYLYYLSRASETIKVGGVWMSPTETERFLAHHPLVAECAVVLHEHPEPLVRPYAFVVPSDGVPATPETELRIRADLAARHARSQVPHKIFFLEQLPRSGNGKVQRFALASKVQDFLSLELQN